MFKEFMQALQQMWAALGLEGAVLITLLLFFAMSLYYYDRHQQRKNKSDSKSDESIADRESAAQAALVEMAKDLIAQRDALNDQRFAAQTKLIAALESRVAQQTESITQLSADIENCDRERTQMAEKHKIEIDELKNEISELKARLLLHENKGDI